MHLSLLLQALPSKIKNPTSQNESGGFDLIHTSPSGSEKVKGHIELKAHS